jgi:hypothetical protein
MEQRLIDLVLSKNQPNVKAGRLLGFTVISHHNKADFTPPCYTAASKVSTVNVSKRRIIKSISGA